MRLAYTTDPRLRGRLGSWLSRRALEREQARVLAERAAEAGTSIQQFRTAKRKAELPGDIDAIRGLPAQMSGAGGAISGTRPNGEPFRLPEPPLDKSSPFRRLRSPKVT